MTSAKHNTGLQIIFSIFLGVMVTAFIGVGVYTFYEPPEMLYQDEIDELYREQEDIQGFKEFDTLTQAERARLNEIQDEIREIEDERQAKREVWGRNTSIVLIAFATLAMSISLVRADQLPVISNGLLLGGVFTMVYGVGWIIATGTSIVRFAVMTVALLITLSLGYVRFVRGREEQARSVTAAGVAGSVEGGDYGLLQERVRALEKRIDAVARALTPED
jgi:hypothetical protein